MLPNQRALNSGTSMMSRPCVNLVHSSANSLASVAIGLGNRGDWAGQRQGLWKYIDAEQCQDHQGHCTYDVYPKLRDDHSMRFVPVAVCSGVGLQLDEVGAEDSCYQSSRQVHWRNDCQCLQHL
jgi:hypothetical protein